MPKGRQSKSYRSPSKTKQRVAKTNKAKAARSAKQKAYRTPMATRQRVAKSRANGSGKSGPRVPNKEHIGTTVGKAAKAVAKAKKK